MEYRTIPRLRRLPEGVVVVTYAYDFSIVPGPGPDVITANAGEGALTYGTGTQQSPDYLASLDSAGLHHVLIWEHNTDSVLGGYDYGVSECKAWEASHPPGLVYLACDLNDGALGGASVQPFCAGWCDTTREAVVGLYGPDRAWTQVRWIVPKMQRMWGVVNWLDGGYANNDPRNISRWTDLGASIIQLIGSPIPDTDQNLILRGDWWTVGAPPAPAPSQEDEESMYPRIWTTGTGGWFITWIEPAKCRRVKRALTGDEATQWQKEAVFGRVANVFATGTTPWVVSQSALDALPNV